MRTREAPHATPFQINVAKAKSYTSCQTLTQMSKFAQIKSYAKKAGLYSTKYPQGLSNEVKVDARAVAETD